MCATIDDAHREAIRKKIELKRRIEKASLQAVESLLECNIDENEFLNLCNNLWQESYQDCTEERALSLLCGYPLCDNPLQPRSKKLPMYKICTKSNKVFSMQKRRNFCSTACQNASEYVKLQLCEVPLWMTDCASSRNVHILRQGKEKPNLVESVTLVEQIKVEKPEIEIIEKIIPAISIPDNQISDFAQEEIKVAIPEPCKMETSSSISVERLESMLCGYVTISTLHFVLGREEFLKLRATHDHGLTSSELSVEELAVRFEKLCRFLDEQEKSENLSSSKTTRITKRLNPKTKVSFAEGTKSPAVTKGTNNVTVFKEPILPASAKHDRLMLRKQVFIERIHPFVDMIGNKVNESFTRTMRDINTLVGTFNLTADNCCVRLHEAPLIVAVIFMFLDRKNGGEGRIPENVGDILSESISRVGITWNDVKVAVQKATDPKRLFSDQAHQ